MEDKTIVLDTLKMLAKDLQRERFSLVVIKKQKNILNAEEKRISGKIKEIRNRINYNLAKHGELLKE